MSSFSLPLVNLCNLHLWWKSGKEVINEISFLMSSIIYKSQDDFYQGEIISVVSRKYHQRAHKIAHHILRYTYAHKYRNRVELENALTRVTVYGMRTGPVQCARGSRGRGTASERTASARRWRSGGSGGRRRLLCRDGDIVGTRSRWHPLASTH